MRKLNPLWPLIAVTSLCLLATTYGCGSSGGGRRAGTGGNAGTSPTLGSGVSARLSAGVTLPDNEGDELIEPEIDESIVIPPNTTSDPVAISPGEVVQVQIEFEAPEGNVIAAGIRFGEDGPIRQIELPQAEGQTAGTLSFDMQIPADICDDAAQICHDIICNEFAITSAGKISRANVVQMGVLCSNSCSEPTCQELLMCEPTADAGTEPPMPGTSATCASVCASIASACAAEAGGCEGECAQDEANSASCGEQAGWAEMLSCCQQGALADFCSEGGFDICQKGACAELRPAGAADGCPAPPAP